MAEIIQKKGKKYNIFDKINQVWNQCSFWTHADDVEFDDGKTASTKLSAIDGITSDLSGESETVAASIKCVNQLNNSLEWKLVGSATGEVAISLPNNAKEFLLIVRNGTNIIKSTIERFLLSETENVLTISGGYFGLQYGTGCNVFISINSVKLRNTSIDSVNLTKTSTLTIYYR